MSPNIALVLAIGVLFATGVYLLLERSLTRILVGFILVGNGANLLFMVASGRSGAAPIVGSAEPGDMADPLPQAMVLTAIVITFGVVAFGLAMAYRSWQLHGHDEVQDDFEDRRIAYLAAERAQIDDYDGSTIVDEEAASHHDENYGDEDAAPAEPGPAAGYEPTPQQADKRDAERDEAGDQ